MPRLTVIMPVRDGAATIRTAVRSTLRALPSDGELHVMDDASSDGTASVLAGIADRRLHVHRAETPLGVARALGRLLDTTDSEFVARMDADDVVLPGRFARQRRALDRAGAAIGFGTVVEFSVSPRRARPPRPVGIDPEEFPLHLLLTNPVAHPAMIARRAALDELGGYREVPSEDYDLWLRASASGIRLHRSAMPSIAYRLHAGQVTASTLWRTSSWLDPSTATAFAALSVRVLGVPARRLTALAIDRELTEEQFGAEVQAFAGRVRTASRALRPSAARRVRALLDRRLAAVDRIRADRSAA